MKLVSYSNLLLKLRGEKIQSKQTQLVYELYLRYLLRNFSVKATDLLAFISLFIFFALRFI